MKTLQINSQALFKIRWVHLITALGLVLLWFALPKMISHYEPAAGLLDSGIIQIILLGITCYFILIMLSAWILSRFWMLAGLPPVKLMVLQFQNLNTWQQLGFYWASFALLLLAGLGCLAAVL